MTDETPRPPIPPRQAQKPPRVSRQQNHKPRAPFLPTERHPHGWLTKHHGHPQSLDEKK